MCERGSLGFQDFSRRVGHIARLDQRDPAVVSINWIERDINADLAI
jgi:hypothetical protein